MRYAFLLLTVAFIAKQSEGSDIYVSWKLKAEQLTINCTVVNLHNEVSIFGPSGDLEAHCLPPVNTPRCTSLNTEGRVTQMLITNTTLYTLQDKDVTRFNGKWKCQHGSRKDTSIEVKITKVLQYVMRDNACYQKCVTWTVIGFLPTFIIIRILIWSVAFVSEVKGNVTTSLVSLCTCVGPKRLISAIVCRRIVIILISVYFFILPFIIGILEKTRCKVPELFSLAGVVCGLLVNIVWNEDKHNHELQNNSGVNIAMLTSQSPQGV